MKTTRDDELKKYAMYGLAAFLPGMQYMVERMQKELDSLRAQLAGIQETETEPRPRKQSTGKGKYGWGGMTAGERSAEMRRRMAKRTRTGWEGMSAEERKVEMARRLKGPVKQVEPEAFDRRSKDHPDHEEWADKVRKARKRAWKKKSPEQREAWLAAMKAGKARADRQRRKIERASINAPLVTMERTA